MTLLAAAVLVARLTTASATPAEAPAQDRTCKGESEGDYRVIDLRRGATRLVVFGARHLTDPEAPIFEEIARRVAELSPTVFLVEGRAPPQEPAGREEGIRRGGEIGFACQLARERAVPCRHADLEEREEARRLMRTYSSDEVLVYLAVRVLAYFNPRPADQRPPGDLVAWLLSRYAPLVGCSGMTPGELASSGGECWGARSIPTRSRPIGTIRSRSSCSHSAFRGPTTRSASPSCASS